MSGKTILITGGTGLLGKGMEETAPNGWTIVSLHQRSYEVEDSRAEHLVLDIRDKSKVDRLFEERAFDLVVHAAGIASVDYVEKHYAESLESNIVGTLNLTSACRRADIHLVNVSTNAVFDGEGAPYDELHPTNPVNNYGRLKVECERLVAETLDRYTIVRPILMYGWNHAVCRPNPVTWIYDKLMRGEAIRLVNDVRENPLYNLQCGQALWRLAESRKGGIFHLAGGEGLNRCEFGLKIAEAFGLDASLIAEVDSSAFPAIARRPKDTRFVVDRMERELGVKPLTIEEGLRDMKARMRVKA